MQQHELHDTERNSHTHTLSSVDHRPTWQAQQYLPSRVLPSFFLYRFTTRKRLSRGKDFTRSNLDPPELD